MLKNKQKVDVDWQHQLANAVREGALISSAILAVLLILSLASYFPADPGWREAGQFVTVQNLGGHFGAVVADVLFSLLGYMAYMLAALPIVQLIKRLTGPTIRHSWLGLSWRFLGLSLLLTSGAALTSLYETGSDLPLGVGGAIGEGVSLWLSDAFGLVGGTLLLAGLFLFGLTVFGDISWLATLDRLGGLILLACKQMIAGVTLRKRKDPIIPTLNPTPEPTFESGYKNAPKKAFIKEPIIRQATGGLAESEENKRDPKSEVEPEATSNRLKSLFKKNNSSDQTPQHESPLKPQQTAEPSSNPPWDDNTDLIVDTDKADAAANKNTSSDNSSAKAGAKTTPEQQEGKKLLIQPFEKKSKGQTAAQGSLFSSTELPPLSLLRHQDGPQETGYSPEQLEHMSRLLEQKLKDFGVKIEVVAVSPGPVITRFEIQPAPGVKASKISNLAKDLARSLAMVSVRVVEVIPGKSVMGLEVPNENRAMVLLGDVLASSEYQSSKSPLSLALGHDIAGDPVTADLAKMPHLLVAGTTGSGKSVGVNSMLVSMLYKSTPDDVRLIMVDPKMLELSVYDGIPHLLTPVITDMKEAANGLRWCVGEMERRYKLMAAMGVRNIAGFNKKVLDAIAAGEPLKDPLWKPEESFDPTPPDLNKLPYIVVVIDEFADMMMIVGKKVEELIARIAQKARAAGIHLILATQRPSVDIITGLIKANVPTRMAFQVSSRIDSRTILDQGGAEQLLGHGDMLYLPPGTSLPIRVHGAFVDDDEVHAVVAEWQKRGEPEYIDAITDGGEANIPGVPPAEGAEGDGEQDALFDEAVAFVTETRKVSISSVQRKLRIGYNRAARLVETMEQAGVVSTPSQNGQREVLAPPPVSMD